MGSNNKYVTSFFLRINTPYVLNQLIGHGVFTYGKAADIELGFIRKDRGFQGMHDGLEDFHSGKAARWC
jgi:hypothetical protein